MKFNNSDTIWPSNIYKKRDIDKFNPIKCTFLPTSTGINSLDLTTSGSLIPSINSGNNIYNNLNLWTTGVGKIIDISVSSKKIYKLDTNLDSSVNITSWQITNQFCLSNNVLNSDGTIVYDSIPSKVVM